MNDESDLNQLQSIILRDNALNGDKDTIDSNTLIMKSIDDDTIDWLDLSSLSRFKGGGNNFNCIGKVIIEGMIDGYLGHRYF